MAHDFYIDETDTKIGPVVRWNSSNNIPPEGMLERFLLSGYITDTEMMNSRIARKIEDEAAIAAYVARRRDFGYSDEEKFEMQAAFGGEEVVDIFTGQVVSYQ